MIEILSRKRPVPLTSEDVDAWACMHLGNDTLWHFLRRNSAPQDARDGEAMFAATDAAGDLAGIAWWNALTPADRAHWMDAAGNTGVAADAWAAFKRRIRETPV